MAKHNIERNDVSWMTNWGQTR